MNICPAGVDQLRLFFSYLHLYPQGPQPLYALQFLQLQLFNLAGDAFQAYFTRIGKIRKPKKLINTGRFPIKQCHILYCSIQHKPNILFQDNVASAKAH